MRNRQKKKERKTWTDFADWSCIKTSDHISWVPRFEQKKQKTEPVFGSCFLPRQELKRSPIHLIFNLQYWCTKLLWRTVNQGARSRRQLPARTDSDSLHLLPREVCPFANRSGIFLARQHQVSHYGRAISARDLLTAWVKSAKCPVTTPVKVSLMQTWPLISL